MKIALYTPLPRLAGELCDVLRLFYPVEGFAVSATAPVPERDAAKAQYTATPVTGDMEPLWHSFTEAGGVWRCEFRFCGQAAVREATADAEDGADAETDADADTDSPTADGTTADSATADGTPADRTPADGPTANRVPADGVASAAAAASTAVEAKAADSAANASGEPHSLPTETDAARRAALLRARLQKRLCKLTLYDLCKALTGHRPPWGSLTGIRPTRLLYERLSQGQSPAQAEAALCALFDVSPEKAALLGRIVAVQQTLPAPGPDEADVYLSIPFCRTRCAYCSFPGEALGRGRQVKPYLDALFAEMRAASALMRDRGLVLRALYIGGGTPTALDEEAFAALMAETAACFSAPREFTVEAGRPDTITEGKLRAMLRAGAARVSVNPQTMNDSTLIAIGRGHSAAQTVEAFRMARGLGFANINMDVIAGLPGETPDDFARTLAAVEALGPDSLTVHTLAIKRASRLHLCGAPLPPAADVAEMVEQGERAAARMGQQPYYLYRQKYMAGQQQNVGYARPGAACLYNVDIMEETASVLACGAGAISKRVFVGRQLRIERAPNVSNVSVYVERAAEMAARKAALFTEA